MDEDDRFLNALREEPRPEFAHALHERLRAQGPARAARLVLGTPRGFRFRLATAGAAAIALAVVVASFSLPAVRASAQAFLDLFRVRNFAAVPVDPARIERLKSKDLDLASLIGDKADSRGADVKPRIVGSLGEASALAGFAAKTPADLHGLRPDTVAVVEGRTVSFQVRTARLQNVLEQLDIRDLQVPAGLDGQTITVRTTPAVAQRFASERRHVALIQARSPEVSLPAGTDLQRLGEIALRVAGLEPGEARRFARSIDWHGTMIVPVPLDASSFTEVTVRGAKGLLVTCHAKRGGGGHEGDILLWGEDGMIYALSGNLSGVPLVQMAESLR